MCLDAKLDSQIFRNVRPWIEEPSFAKDKDKLRAIISSAQRLDLKSIDDFDTLINQRMMCTALRFFHDDTHFINSKIERWPSGQCRLFKTQTKWGSNSFYRYMAETINE